MARHNDFGNKLAEALRAAKWEWWNTPVVYFIILFTVFGLVLYNLCYIVYNLYFHPLKRFPGPILARSTLLWRLFHSFGGRFHRAIQHQHQIHGDVVRISPNELSFASVGSWKDIYGHQPSLDKVHIKDEFYDMYGSGYKSLCVGSERDPQKHSRMRKSLTPAFSTKALLEQEYIIDGCVNDFVREIGVASKETGGKGVNITKWFEMLAFDILGAAAFGESFHAIENGKPHFWSELIVDHLFFITVLDNLRRIPLVLFLGKRLMPWATTSVRDRHSGYTRAKVQRRLENKSGRKDFLTNLVSKVESGEIEKEELTAHSSTLVVAGGETTATFLAAVMYHLLHSPDAFNRLTSEIRSAFPTYYSIKASTVQQLPYLRAVISEGLRSYPPGSQGFPRRCAGAFIDGHWVPEGTEIYTSAFTVTHDPRYFHEPDSFLPERWIDPECMDVKEASQPFSLGSRGCLGRNFANVEMCLVLSKLFWKYDLHALDPELDWEGQSTMHVMWNKPALRVLLRERI